MFIFQKPDPDLVPPIMTPMLQEGSHMHEEVGICHMLGVSSEFSSYCMCAMAPIY